MQCPRKHLDQHICDTLWQMGINSLRTCQWLEPQQVFGPVHHHTYVATLLTISSISAMHSIAASSSPALPDAPLTAAPTHLLNPLTDGNEH